MGRNFAFQNGLGLTIKTANSNSPWACIRGGLLSEGYLRLRFGGLIFSGRLFFFGGGGAYCGNFTVCCHGPEGSSVLLRGFGGGGIETIWHGGHDLQSNTLNVTHICRNGRNESEV